MNSGKVKLTPYLMRCRNVVGNTHGTLKLRAATSGKFDEQLCSNLKLIAELIGGCHELPELQEFYPSLQLYASQCEAGKNIGELYGDIMETFAEIKHILYSKCEE